MRAYKHTLIWVSIVGVIALMFVKLPQLAARQDSVWRTFSPLVEVDALVKQQYVEQIRDPRLVEGALRGMLLELDPYSRYLSPDELASYTRLSQGDYAGVGVVLGMRDGQLTVIAPVEGSPAAQAGIAPGDVLVEVHKRSTKGLSVPEVEDLLLGPAGSTVSLAVLSPPAREPLHLTITRQDVTLRTVRGFRRHADGSWDYLIDPDRRIGYVRVSNFRASTGREFGAALRRVHRQGVTGLILDLRFNPGGLLEQGVAVADHFIAKGQIVSTVTRRRAVREFDATGAGTWSNVDLVVLVNGSSASASEIVSGALQDHRRATIIGTRTFGKGSVQHLIPLADDRAAVKLTVAYYRLPGGRFIHRANYHTEDHDWGIRPDFELELSREETSALRAARRALDCGRPDADLARVDEPGARAEASPTAAPPDSADSLLDFGGTILIDRQLEAALRLLRGEPPVSPASALPHETAP